jgi:outer membrane protein OmpA-like peptidoglycan-associated protein
MTQVETIHRDSRSYRQGLVLGLTMAEVFLLLVFALLMALGAMWNTERQRCEALEKKLNLTTVVLDSSLLDEVTAALAASSQTSVTEALTHLRNGRQLEPLSGPEKEFLSEVRAQQSGAPPGVITDNWRTLTRAVRKLQNLPGYLDVGEAVAAVLPNENDRSRLVSLVQGGLAAEMKGEHDWPPIINLNEAKGYYFEKGKAELLPAFEDRLRAFIVPELVERAQRYAVTVIEVVGHTDEQKIAPRPSNLDAFLLDIVRTNGKVASLIPGDNAGLGLARAAAVVQVLRHDPRLSAYTLLPLSGGQLIGVDEQLTTGGGGDDRERRRIEIRLRRANTLQSTPVTTAR